MATCLIFARVALADPIEFRNFDQTLVLVDEPQGYRIAQTDHYVQVAHRLVVKMRRAVSYSELRNHYPFISEIKELFVSNSLTYLRVSLNQGFGIQAAISELEQDKSIELVQPDILQLSQKAHSKGGKGRVQTLGEVFGEESAWPAGEGEGVRVAVIDDGFDFTHPEFSDLRTVFSYDTSRKTMGAGPVGREDIHGTKIAGILFAREGDGNEVTGLVPSAEFIAIRQPDSWTSNSLLSFQLAALADADVVNCSWNTPLLLEPVADAITSLATNGRGGLGAAVVFASGNQGSQIRSGDSEASIEAAIVVGAGDGNGHALPFSNFGQSVDLTAYGLPLMTTSSGGGYGHFGGTSLSAALVSGLSARLISENPDLSLSELNLELRKRLKHPGISSGQSSNEF